MDLTRRNGGDRVKAVQTFEKMKVAKKEVKVAAKKKGSWCSIF